MTSRDRFLERIHFREVYLAARAAKAEKIVRILRRHRPDLAQVWLLDIGCSRGQITERLAREAAFAVGVECDAEKQPEGRTYQFVQADGCCLPLAASVFDVVVINHILEHVSSPAALLDEVWRVLRPGGIVYLACPNRLNLVEPHYRLPLLSWLPRAWADRYVRWAGRGDRYRDNLPHYWRLKRLTRRFSVSDQTLAVLKEPAHFLPGDPQYDWKISLAAKLPGWLLKLLLPCMPVWILILKKETDSGGQKKSDLRKAAV